MGFYNDLLCLVGIFVIKIGVIILVVDCFEFYIKGVGGYVVKLE